MTTADFSPLMELPATSTTVFAETSPTAISGACAASAACTQQPDWSVATSCGCHTWVVCGDHFGANAWRLYALRSGALVASCDRCGVRTDVSFYPTRTSLAA